jgi:hypothetical protein
MISIFELAEFCIALLIVHTVLPSFSQEWAMLPYFAAVALGGFSVGIWVAMRQIMKQKNEI